MTRRVLYAVAICLVTGLASAQTDKQLPESRMVLGGGNEYLSAGAEAIRAGQYDDGIRLTNLGLKRPTSVAVKAAAFSNLCAAHVAKGEVDLAIQYCTDSIALDAASWRPYSNRSYAYFLKGMYREANADLKVATSMSPKARQVATIRGMINERNLRPSIVIEEHQ